MNNYESVFQFIDVSQVSSPIFVKLHFWKTFDQSKPNTSRKGLVFPLNLRVAPLLIDDARRYHPLF